MSTEQNKTLFRRFIDEVVNRGNFAAIDELVAPSFVEHEELPPNIPPGIEGVKAFFAEWRRGFPDGKVAVELVIAEGDLVACYQVWSGTHTGEFTGIPPSGKPVNFKVVDIVRIADNRMVEHWAVSDNLALMQQIGVIPAQG